MSMEMKFNSQICTTREQSERLIALGLKKETADMCSVVDLVSDNGKTIEEVDTIFSFTPDDWEDFGRHVTPRWSLHRLIEMRLAYDSFVVFQLNNTEDAFEKVISHIEHAIKEGYFNKEYLV